MSLILFPAFVALFLLADYAYSYKETKIIGVIGFIVTIIVMGMWIYSDLQAINVI